MIRIDRLHVENFKSIKSLDLELGPLNVLVGPNNAGKSNILDCFGFLGDFVRDPDQAFQARGGLRRVVRNGDSAQAIGMRFCGTWFQDRKGGKKKISEMQFEYEVKFLGHVSVSFILDREKLSLRNSGEVLLDGGATGEGSAQSQYVVIGGIHHQSRNPGQSILAGLRYPTSGAHPLLIEFAQEINNWQTYSIIPLHAREPNEARLGLLMSPHGENLAQVLHSIFSEYPEIFKQIEELVQAAFPGVTALRSPLTTSGKTLVGTTEQSHQFLSGSLSEGTLRFLGVLATVYSPESSCVICIEEPENAIHPRALQLLVDILRSRTERHQFVLTTHSPYLVDLVRPEELTVVEKTITKGTVAKRASKIRGTKEAIKSLGLGELWYSGHLGGVPQ